MRTTQGRERLDVIYRRLDDDFLDPLTFRPDSALGVAGLMDLYRAGRVTIVNAPGGGIADDKAVYSYVPDIVQFYTGQRPILQNVPTWRCSIPAELDHVLAHLPELVVKEVHGSGGYGMLVGPTASRRELEAFREKLRSAAGELYRAADAGALHLPGADAERGRAAPRRSEALRAGVGPRAPGAGRADARGAEEGLARRQLLAGRRHQGHLGAAGLGTMLARTAESLFWMSRYMERAENMARLAEAGFRISLTPEAGVDGHREEWRSTLAGAGVLDQFLDKYGDASFDSAIAFILFDEDNSSSVRSCLENARTNARSVRTKITRDMWEAMNTTWLDFSAIKPREITAARLPELIDWIRQRTALFRGSLLGTILRDDGYYFSQLGAFVERADNTARILDVKYFILLPSNQAIGGEVDTYQWETILRSVSAHRSYRHVFHETYRPWNVADFLILHAGDAALAALLLRLAACGGRRTCPCSTTSDSPRPTSSARRAAC